MDIQQLFHLTVTNKASDLHLVPGVPPALRIDGALVYVSNARALSNEDVHAMIFSLLSQGQKDKFLMNKELDFSFSFAVGTASEMGRFRANIYFQKNMICGEFRFLEPKIRTIEELNMPENSSQLRIPEARTDFGNRAYRAWQVDDSCSNYK